MTQDEIERIKQLVLKHHRSDVIRALERMEAEQTAPLVAELSAVLNRHSAENGSNTPDFILAGFLAECLNAWDRAMAARSRWYEPPRSDGDNEPIQLPAPDEGP